ncbi:hypothetical protein PQZ39_01110 [bacterium]|nr:hypothetical protein [bacterium]
MPLVDLRTNLKSLRYGKDRVGGGSSNQPYIQRDLPDSLSEVGRTGGPDFLLRGGTLVPARVGRDVSRLTQMFFDLKTPNGVLFAAKQNVLALSSTNFKAGKEEKVFGNGTRVGDFLRNNIDLPLDNVYNPLSTIAQVAGGPIGLHLYKQGLNPITGPTKYSDYLKDKNNSRLLGFANNDLLTSNSTNLYSYTGGPGATLGVGKTRIRRYENTDNGYSALKTLSDSKRALGNGDTSIVDFRKNTKSLSYKSENIETRVNLGNPGKKADRSDYQKGLPQALDKLNAMQLYQSTGIGSAQGDSIDNDLVKFRIGVIDNDNPSNKTYMHFRAFIDSMSETYTPEWNSEKLLGRAENFYRYNGFDRSLSLSWTVVAQSKQELIPMYRKLNYLASSLAPDYSDFGYMRGNLVTLTLGGWFYEQPGIIRGMTLEVPNDSPWEIGIPSNTGTGIAADESPVKTDPTVKELPHIIKVTGFQFTPIHEFVPRLQQNNYNGVQPGNEGLINNTVNSFGPERYIALANGKGLRGLNNYDRETGINE